MTKDHSTFRRLTVWSNVAISMLLPVILFCACAAVGDHHRQIPSCTAETLLATEHQRLDALLRSDVASLEPLYDANFTAIGRGNTLSRKEYFEALRSGATKLESAEHTNSQVSTYGNLGLIVGTARVRGRWKGVDFARYSQFNHIYVCSPFGWKLLQTHNSDIPPR